MLNAIIHGCQNYYDQIPDDTLSKVVRSALYSFTVTYAFSNFNSSTQVNLARPAFAAGAAALASLIYAVTNPIFNMAFGDDRLVIHREVIKHIVNVGLSSLLLNYLMIEKINMFSLNLIGSLSCNVLLSVLEISPIISDWLGEPAAAQEIRDAYKFIGFDSVPGSSSVFLHFGQQFA